MKKELKNTKKKNNKGFSLVELIVVIAIMAVLMAVLAPAMLRYVEKSRIQKDNSAVAELVNALNVTLSDEDATNAIPEATTSFTVTVAGSTGNITFSDTNLKSGNKFYDEVTTTLKGSKLSITSKEYKNQTDTITVEYKDKTWTVTDGGWKK